MPDGRLQPSVGYGRQQLLRSRPADFFGCLPRGASFTHCLPVSLRSDDLQNRPDLLAELRPDPQKLGLLRRRRY
jgi:hypothetical protein